MRLTKEYILKRINRLLITFKVTWDDLIDELDMGIEEINKYLSTKYPYVSEVLDKHASPDKTYSYRAGGKDIPFFPMKYFNSIVIPFAAMQLLTIEEEFSEIYSKYANEWQENLFVMARDEMNNIPHKFMEAPQGVYFANPHPDFKRDPEHYFNRKIRIEDPKLKVEYSWGNFYRWLPTSVKEAFVDKPLPIDNNFYKEGDEFFPISLTGQNFKTYLVDYNKSVLGIFLGWSLTDSGSLSDVIATEKPLEFGSEDIKLYAVFDMDVIGVIYKGNGGTVTNFEPQYIGSSLINKHVSPYGGSASRIGCEFIGWQPVSHFISQDNINPEIEDSPYWLEAANDSTPEEPIIFTAQWRRKQYQINYELFKQEDQITIDLAEKNYYYGNKVELVKINRDAFIGWWDNNLFKGEPVTQIPAGETGDKTFYAKYNERLFSITFINNQIGSERLIFTLENLISYGSFMPEINSISGLEELKQNYEKEENGLFWIFEFGFWVLKDTNEEYTPGMKVSRNLIFEPIYKKESPKLIDIFFEFRTREEVVFKTVNVELQKGTFFNESQIISLLLSVQEFENITTIDDQKYAYQNFQVPLNYRFTESGSIFNIYYDRVEEEEIKELGINLFSPIEKTLDLIEIELSNFIDKLNWDQELDEFFVENIHEALNWDEEESNQKEKDLALYSGKESELVIDYNNPITDILLARYDTIPSSIIKNIYEEKTGLNFKDPIIIGDSSEYYILDLMIRNSDNLLFDLPNQINISETENLDIVPKLSREKVIYPEDIYVEFIVKDGPVILFSKKYYKKHFDYITINPDNYLYLYYEKENSIDHTFYSLEFDGVVISKDHIQTINLYNRNKSKQFILEARYIENKNVKINVNVECDLDIEGINKDDLYIKTILKEYENYYKDKIEHFINEQLYDNLRIPHNKRNENITIFNSKEMLLQAITDNTNKFINIQRDEFTALTDFVSYRQDLLPIVETEPVTIFVPPFANATDIKFKFVIKENLVPQYYYFHIQENFIDGTIKSVLYEQDINDLKQFLVTAYEGQNISNLQIWKPNATYLNPNNTSETITNITKNTKAILKIE